MIFILLLLLALFILAFFINASLFCPRTRASINIDGKKVTFLSGRNHLEGYIWNEEGKVGLLVFAHGMGTNVEYYLSEIHHFVKKGYKVFAFEYSGYNESSGHFYGFPQAVIDLKNAINFIDDGSRPLILMGHSMGAYAVCAVSKFLKRKVSAIIAYAPFFSSDEAIIAEASNNMPKIGKLISWLIIPMQRILFGTKCNPYAYFCYAQTLVLQGSEDVEVKPDGCALYAYKNELSKLPITFRLIEEKGSNGHMTVIRKKGSHGVNFDTMRIVEDFLEKMLKKNK